MAARRFRIANRVKWAAIAVVSLPALFALASFVVSAPWWLKPVFGAVGAALAAALVFDLSSGISVDADGVEVRSRLGRRVRHPWEDIAEFTLLNVGIRWWLAVVLTDGTTLTSNASEVFFPRGPIATDQLTRLESARRTAQAAGL